MSLNKPVLQSAIKTLLTDMMTREESSIDEFAQRLSNAIDAFVKSATVTIAPGITVTTAGTATAQTGATTSNGTGTIS